MHIRVIHNALISGMYPTQSKTRVETMRVTAVDVSITAGAKPSLRKVTAVDVSITAGAKSVDYQTSTTATMVRCLQYNMRLLVNQ